MEMTLRFQAVAASQHALSILRSADGGRGEIHSAYRRTINLRFPSDQLVSLHGGHSLVAPFGIALGQHFGSPAFERLPPGLRAEMANGLLRIPETGLEVALEGSPVWQPKARPLALEAAAAARQAEHLTSVLLQHGSPDGLGRLVEESDATPLLRRARPSAAHLAEGLARRDAEPLLAGAEPLLGLGPGLTPSGDDVLAGFLGLAVLASPGAAPLLHEVGRGVLRLAEARTTLLSRAFLAHALDGVLAPPVDALAATILSGAPRLAVVEAARAASGLGHTSGMDMLAGIVLALRALGRTSP
jgi:hypothetical protein